MTAAQNASAEKVTGTEILIADPLETARTFEPIIFTLPVGCDAPLLWAELEGIAEPVVCQRLAAQLNAGGSFICRHNQLCGHNPTDDHRHL